jgi:phosphohistidine phosphatase SixA
VLVGHNPGLESLVPLLVGGREDHLPPAGLAHLTLPVDRWAAVQPGTATLRDWVLPES